EVSLLDALPFLDPQIGHAAHGVGADVDQPTRLNLARCRDDRLQIALLDRLDVDRRALLPLELEIGEDDRADDDDDADADQDFLVSTHAPPRLFKSAIATAITAYTDSSEIAIGRVRRL